MVRKESGLVDTQQKIDLPDRSLDILELHSGEERSDLGQIDWRKMSCDVTDPEGEDVLDLSGGCTQWDSVGEGLPLLGFLPSHLQVLSNRCAWQP